jgi:hypothetical protein
MPPRTKQGYKVFVSFGTSKMSNRSKIKPPSQGVVAKQDPHHTRGDFLADLDKVTQRKRRPS